MAIPPVVRTRDFDRVVNLPRRTPTLEDAIAWAEVFTAELRLPRSAATLRPWQGYALAEIASAPPGRGAWLALPVGLGKTLITYAALEVMGAKRPLFIGAKTLEAKTWKNFARLRRDWKAPRCPIKYLGREALGRESYAKAIDEYAPDVIVLDEGDELANYTSAATSRIDRYVEANPHVRVIVLTGTPGRLSVMDYWHQLIWCLREGAPVPLRRAEAENWAWALDERPRSPKRPSPGPLGGTRDEAMAWFRRRLLETPGVLIVDGDSCDQPITIRQIPAREDPVLDEHFDTFRKYAKTPGGEFVSDPLSGWRLEGQLGCGLYSRYIVPPPAEWLEARRTVAKFVRDRIMYSQRSYHPLDTEAQVFRRHPDAAPVVEWQRVRGTFIPEMETVWLSTSTLQSVADWVKSEADPGVIWTGSVEFGEALATALSCDYFGAEGRSRRTGRGLEAFEDTGHATETIVCSWNANKRGFNLQSWRRMLLVMPPQSAKWLEQVFGRLHRQGQDRPVTVDFLVTSGGTIDLFEAAFGEAQFQKRTTSLTQKILRATIERRRPRKTPRNRNRWASKTEE